MVSHQSGNITYTIVLPGVPVTSTRGALGWCSVTLVQTAGRNILFDAGSYGDRRLLLDRLEELGLTPSDIDTVFLSHFHFDHALNAELFTHAKLLISEAEYEYIATEAYIEAGDHYVPESLALALRDRLTTVPDGELIADGARAVSLPGHTPGNMGVILEEASVLLAGDAVKNAWEFVRGIAPPSFHSSKLALENYDKVKSMVDVIVPGHDRPFRIIDRARIEYLDHRPVRIDYFGDPYSDVQDLALP